MAIGVLALIGMAGIAYIGLSRDRGNGAAVWRDPSAGLFVSKAQVVIPMSEEKALDLVRKVLNVRSKGDLGDKARLKDISADEAVEFLANLEQKDGKVSRMDWIGNMDSNGIQIEGVEIVFEKETSRPRRALLTPNENGLWQVDIASLAGRSSMDWSKIISQPEVQADLRVVIVRDNYYNGRFSDDREWAAYALAGPDSDIMLIGYCPRDGETNQILGSLLKESNGVKAVVRIRKRDAPGNRQCEIVSVLAENWILTDTPLEEQLQGAAPAGEVEPGP